MALDLSNGSQVRVTWSDNSSDETGFELVREHQSGTTWGNRATLAIGANASAHTDSPGVGTYRYQVRAVNGAGGSAYTGFAQVSVVSPAPGAPSGLIASDGGSGAVNLAWTDNSTNETGFVIERIPAFSGSTSVAANATGFADTVGASGTYQYRVKATGVSTDSAWTPYAAVTVAIGPGPGGGTGGEGWTILNPSADSRVIYVSSTLGNNANDGRSANTPVRTIAAGYALMRDGQPDHLYLKRGDSWDEEFGSWHKSGRSPTERMVIKDYGDESLPLPVLRTGTLGAFTRSGGSASPFELSSLAIQNIHMWAHQRTAANGGEGLVWLKRGRDLLIEGCRFEGYSFNMVFQDVDGTHNNIVLRRNAIIDAYFTSFHSQGIFAAGVNNLTIEENVIDHNGWKAGVAPATIFNHNIYVTPTCSNVRLLKNIISDASSHGAQLRGGGVANDNLFLKNPIALLLGTGGAQGGGEDPVVPLYGEAQRNVIMYSRDLDANNGRGWALSTLWLSSGLITDNIIAHGNAGSDPQGISIDDAQGRGNFNLSITGNIIYDWRCGVNLSGGPTRLNNITFSNNTVHLFGTGDQALLKAPVRLSPGQVISRNNRYFHLASANNWAEIEFARTNVGAWNTMIGDQGSTSTERSFNDPGRSVETYMQSLGLEPTYAAFIARARNNRKGAWDTRFTAEAANAYIRAGFQGN